MRSSIIWAAIFVFGITTFVAVGARADSVNNGTQTTTQPAKKHHHHKKHHKKPTTNPTT